MRRAVRHRAGAAGLARFVSDPAAGLDRLDRSSRLWPVSACLGASGLVAASAGLAGHRSAAAIYTLLAASFLALLLCLLRRVSR